MPTHWQGSAEEIRALNTFIKLNRAVQSINSRLQQNGTQGDLTPSQFAVLEALYHLGEMCQGEISRKILTSTGNMTLVLDNLEKRGLVSRRRDTVDRRIVKIELTETGREMISSILPGHVQNITREMSVLSPEEQDILARLSRKIGCQVSE